VNTETAYNKWAVQYDSHENKTRDLEAVALRELLSGIPFSSCLELGCGTGKNTEWLVKKAAHVTAVDLSEEMMARAREKVPDGNVQFVQADLLEEWRFDNRFYDLVVFSLVLEHIEDITTMIRRAAEVTAPGGHIYIGELHPFKQYTGSKARFETEEGLQVVDCYIHHISDFTCAAADNRLAIVLLKEYFDEGDRNGIPRILGLLLKK